jgi:hypothetical protein
MCFEYASLLGSTHLCVSRNIERKDVEELATSA